MLRKLHCYFLLVVFFYCKLCSASTEASINWLKSQQQPDGSIESQSSISTPYQSTIETLESLSLLNKSDQSYYASALHYINSAQLDDSTENLSRRIVINYRNGVNTSSDVAELLLRRNSDGGFGSRIGYDSTSFDTAYACWALGLANTVSSGITNDAINYIVSAQSEDGGWSFNRQQSSSLSLTSLMLESLRIYSVRYNLSSSIKKASDYIYSLEKPEGGWGNNELTTDALIALIPITIDSTFYAKSLAFLQSSQNANQSWDNDAYVTARALRAINLSQNTPPPVIATEFTVSGQIIDKATGLPLIGAKVTLSGNENAIALTNELGAFSVALTKVGSYSLAYSLDGFHSMSQTFTLSKLQSLNSGIISLEKMTQVDPQSALINGVVRDASTGAVLQGVQVQITGANTFVLATNAQGEYNASIASSGTFTVLVSKLGYRSVTAICLVELGKNIIFSPSLFKEDVAIPADITLSAKILDDATNLPIPASSILLKQKDLELNALSNASGDISLTHLAAGEFSFEISSAGYETVSGVGFAVLGNKIDLGSVRLKAKLMSSSLVGKITNASNGAFISGAKIKIVEEAKEALSKGDGTYTLGNISRLQFSIEISASGFQSVTYQINSLDFQNLNINAQLHPIVNPIGFGINNIYPSEISFGAYQKGTFKADVYNNGNQQEELQMVMEIKNQNGYFERFPATHSIFEGDQIADSILVLHGLVPSVVVEFNWLTGVMPPGDYQVRLLAYDAKTLQLKAEKSTSIKIAETKNVTALVAKISPRFAYFHAQKEIVLTAEATNASNVLIDLPVKYRWKDPAGTILKEGNSMIHLLPSDTQKIVELVRFTDIFNSSGNYQLELELIDSNVAVGTIAQDVISVAPAIRIDPSLDISPSVVTPDGDKTIRLNIKLTGKDDK